MKISIAMATYNGEQYIKEQLQSFLQQTRIPDELIITDDCSTDNTENIVKEFAKTAPFIVRFFRNSKNLGYCANFNEALMKTTGDLVFLSDQDDVWFPRKIEHMIKVSKSNPTALVLMNDAELTDSTLRPVGLTKVQQIKSAGMNLKSFVMGCCCVVRRELLNLSLPIPPEFKGHDNWLIAFAEGLDSKVVDDIPLQYYRRHEQNESQFIANRTDRVTRLDFYRMAMKDLYRTKSPIENNYVAEQKKIFLKGIYNAKEKSTKGHSSQLTALAKKVERDIAIEEERVRIRAKYMAFRFIPATKLLIKGGYKAVNGFKSFIKDLLY